MDVHAGMWEDVLWLPLTSSHIICVMCVLRSNSELFSFFSRQESLGFWVQLKWDMCTETLADIREASVSKNEWERWVTFSSYRVLIVGCFGKV